MAQDEKIFADGFLFKRNEKAPEFVVGRMSIKIEEAVAFMTKHQKGGWVNLDVKTARSGNYYIELDTFESKGKETASTKPAPKPTQQEEEDDQDLPF
jgi:hypothetical protein